MGVHVRPQSPTRQPAWVGCCLDRLRTASWEAKNQQTWLCTGLAVPGFMYVW